MQIPGCYTQNAIIYDQPRTASPPTMTSHVLTSTADSEPYSLISATKFDPFLSKLPFNNEPGDVSSPFFLLHYHVDRLVDAVHKHRWEHALSSLTYKEVKSLCLQAARKMSDPDELQPCKVKGKKKKNPHLPVYIDHELTRFKRYVWFSTGREISQWSLSPHLGSPLIPHCPLSSTPTRIPQAHLPLFSRCTSTPSLRVLPSSLALKPPDVATTTKRVLGLAYHPLARVFLPPLQT
jgi:hypothetical protein